MLSGLELSLSNCSILMNFERKIIIFQINLFKVFKNLIINDMILSIKSYFEKEGINLKCVKSLKYKEKAGEKSINFLH